jgi:branched-chain amino acid transport system permease protein
MHSFSYYLDLLLSGITVGSLYALIAIGYTMVYGILRLINFAHGDIFMMAGFFMVYMSASLGVAASIPLVLIMTVILGVLIERCAYKPLRSAPRMSVMISAIGVSYLLENLATYITGGLAKAYPEIPFLKTTYTIGSMTIKTITIVTPLLTLLLVVALVFFIRYTKIGMAMRAVAKDFDTARLMGIKVNAVISMTFVIGSFLAGVGSILYFTNYGQVSPMIGAMPGLKAFVAAVFGGIGSIPGAVLGAFIIGICESFIKANDSIAIFSNAFTFALLIVVLLFKPNGMFGEKLTEKV